MSEPRDAVTVAGAVGAVDPSATEDGVEYLLQAKSITKRFGGLVAVRDVKTWTSPRGRSSAS